MITLRKPLGSRLLDRTEVYADNLFINQDTDKRFQVYSNCIRIAYYFPMSAAGSLSGIRLSHI